MRNLLEANGVVRGLQFLDGMGLGFLKGLSLRKERAVPRGSHQQVAWRDHPLALGPPTQDPSSGFSWAVWPFRVKMGWGTFTNGPDLRPQKGQHFRNEEKTGVPAPSWSTSRVDPQ